MSHHAVAGPIIGRLIYPRALVHRFDLRLPPAPAEVLTIHDLPPLRFPDEGRLPGHAARSAQHARAVICPSRFAAEEATELLALSKMPEVIPNGVSDTYRDAAPLDDDALRAFGIREPFVMHAAGATERKNLTALALAWQAVAGTRPELQLVLAGPSDSRRAALFRDVPGALLLGRVTPAEVAGLMARCCAVVVPSRYEGFGLPALEGLACGAPVVAADAGALPEVVGDAGLLVPPSAEGLAAGLSAVIDNPALAARLRTAGPLRAAQFSWAKAAVAHLEVYESAGA